MKSPFLLLLLSIICCRADCTYAAEYRIPAEVSNEWKTFTNPGIKGLGGSAIRRLSESGGVCGLMIRPKRDGGVSLHLSLIFKRQYQGENPYLRFLGTVTPINDPRLVGGRLFARRNIEVMRGDGTWVVTDLKNGEQEFASECGPFLQSIPEDFKRAFRGEFGIR